MLSVRAPLLLAHAHAQGRSAGWPAAASEAALPTPNLSRCCRVVVDGVDSADRVSAARSEQQLIGMEGHACDRPHLVRQEGGLSADGTDLGGAGSGVGW